MYIEAAYMMYEVFVQIGERAGDETRMRRMVAEKGRRRVEAT